MGVCNAGCERKQFTESVPQVPPRARFTQRAKHEMAAAVLDDSSTVEEVATAYRASWDTCHDAVAARADEVLAVEPDPVFVLGIDETRRGKAKWEIDPATPRPSGRPCHTHRSWWIDFIWWSWLTK